MAEQDQGEVRCDYAQSLKRSTLGSELAYSGKALPLTGFDGPEQLPCEYKGPAGRAEGDSVAWYIAGLSGSKFQITRQIRYLYGPAPVWISRIVRPYFSGARKNNGGFKMNGMRIFAALLATACLVIGYLMAGWFEHEFGHTLFIDEVASQVHHHFG